MPSPVHEVRALRVVDVPEGRVPVVAGPAEHGVGTADAPREEHPVAVEGQEGVVELREGAEVVRPGQADGRAVAVVAVAPADVVAVLEPGDAGVVGVHEALLDLRHARVHGLEDDGCRVDPPGHAIVAEAGVDVHRARPVIDPEDARVGALEGHHGRVEDAVRAGQQVARDDRVQARPPERADVSGRAVLPGHGGRGRWRLDRRGHGSWSLLRRAHRRQPCAHDGSAPGHCRTSGGDETAQRTLDESCTMGALPFRDRRREASSRRGKAPGIGHEEDRSGW